MLFSFSHPKEVCMTYYEHWIFAMKLSGTFMYGAVATFIHAFIPDIFVTTPSDVNNYIKNRLNMSGCR